MPTKNLIAIIVTFVVAAVVLTFALQGLFDSTAMAVGPAIAIAVGIAAAVHFAMRDKNSIGKRER